MVLTYVVIQCFWCLVLAHFRLLGAWGWSIPQNPFFMGFRDPKSTGNNGVAGFIKWTIKKNRWKFPLMNYLLVLSRNGRMIQSIIITDHPIPRFPKHQQGYHHCHTELEVSWNGGAPKVIHFHGDCSSMNHPFLSFDEPFDDSRAQTA